MVPRSEPPSGGRLEPPHYSLFHQISAIEAFIGNNNPDGDDVKRLTHFAHEDEVVSVIIFQGPEGDLWSTIRVRQLGNIRPAELNALGIRELVHQFAEKDLYVSDSDPDSYLDPIIYDTDKGAAYSVGASLEEETENEGWEWVEDEMDRQEGQELIQGYGEA